MTHEFGDPLPALCVTVVVGICWFHNGSRRSGSVLALSTVYDDTGGQRRLTPAPPLTCSSLPSGVGHTLGRSTIRFCGDAGRSYADKGDHVSNHLPGSMWIISADLFLSVYGLEGVSFKAASLLSAYGKDSMGQVSHAVTN